MDKAAGKHVGRPALGADLQAEITRRLAAGATAWRVAKDLKIDPHTVRKYGTGCVSSDR